MVGAAWTRGVAPQHRAARVGCLGASGGGRGEAERKARRRRKSEQQYRPKKEQASAVQLKRFIEEEGYLPCDTPVKEAYDILGAEQFYDEFGDKYSNPSNTYLEAALSRALTKWDEIGFLAKPSWEDGHPLQRILDLACGSGEATAALLKWGQTQPGMAEVIDAADPFTYEAYERATGRKAYQWSFADIAKGEVLQGRPVYDAVLCTFCLHLLNRTEMFDTLKALAPASRLLIIASPTKKVRVSLGTGWEVLDLVEDTYGTLEGGNSKGYVLVSLFRSVHYGGASGYLD